MMPLRPLQRGMPGGRAVLFPAFTPREMDGGRLFFLFSLKQVEGIAREAKVFPVPFAPSYLKGVASWRGRVAPVISLEESLGLAREKWGEERIIAVRAGKASPAMLKVNSAIRMVTLPIKCAPISVVKAGVKVELVRAFYQWDEGYIMVVHMERLLKG